MTDDTIPPGDHLKLIEAIAADLRARCADTGPLALFAIDRAAALAAALRLEPTHSAGMVDGARFERFSATVTALGQCLAALDIESNPAAPLTVAEITLARSRDVLARTWTNIARRRAA